MPADTSPAKKPKPAASRQQAWAARFVKFGNVCGFLAIVCLPAYYLLGAVDLGVVGGVLRSAIALVGIAAVVLALILFAGVMAAASLYDRVVRLVRWLRGRT